jgi:6-phosphofructokinase 1
VPLEKVAAADRSFPKHWIAPSGYDVTDEFVEYCRPLVGEDMMSLPMVGGRQRLARLQPIFASKKLPPFVPQADRKK